MYSNCLLEAIKAKLKDPNVKIHKIPAKFSPLNTVFPHFWWSKGDRAFEFFSEKSRRFQVILFKGEVQELPIKDMQDNIRRFFRLYTEKQCKKWGNIFKDYEGDIQNTLPHTLEDYRPEIKDNVCCAITIIYKKDDKVCSRLIDAKDLDKYENIICWREASVEVNYLLDLDNNFEFKNEDGLII